MAMTAAERQAAYDKNRPVAGDNGERRIDTWVSTGAALALARLARRDGVTQQDMLERLILAADKQIISKLDPQSPEWDAYFSVTANPHQTDAPLGRSAGKAARRESQIS